MSFDPTTLELFVRIASLEAIGKAGAEFGLSPSAATHRIQTLETELGVRLLSRTTRAVSLTADGTIFLEHARKILTDMEDARSAFTQTTAQLRGEIRVAGPASFGRKHMAPYIAEFLIQHPEISIRLDLSDSRADIAERGYDLAIRIGDLSTTPTSLVARKLADNPRVLVASPEYLKRAGTPQTPEDLDAHNFIVLSNFRNHTLVGPDGTPHNIKVSGNFTTDHGETGTQAALAHLGICVKSMWDVAHYIESGTLVSVLDGYELEPKWSLWALRPPGQVLPARVRAFIDFLAIKFANRAL